jgi:hypothetical protein
VQTCRESQKISVAATEITCEMQYDLKSNAKRLHSHFDYEMTAENAIENRLQNDRKHSDIRTIAQRYQNDRKATVKQTRSDYRAIEDWLQGDCKAIIMRPQSGRKAIATR